MKLQFTNTYPNIGGSVEQTQTITIEHEGWEVSKEEMFDMYRQLWGALFETLLEDDI